MRKVLILLILFLGLVTLWKYGQPFEKYLAVLHNQKPQQVVKVVTEESVTIAAVKTIGPSVVTVVGQGTSQAVDMSPFSFFENGQSVTPSDQTQSIGSGFLISADGLLVTNKHVVSDTTEKYQIVTANDKKYDVQKIYRDPLNDIAILKIDPAQNAGNALKPVTLGDSTNLEVGQFVIAIGTALGEFRNTVTTGVISGLGRGITAGDQFQGSVENLNNVIQTSAPINPGNSGGPLVNSSSQVIGVNTAVAQNGQNIGFTLPINVIKDSLNNFNQTGQFNRPFLGVAHKFITQQLAILNDLPSGAYIQNVVPDSPADRAGIKSGDIIMKIDGQKLDETSNSLVTIISHKKVGDTITLTLWRDSNTLDVSVTLTAAPNQ